MSGTIADSLCIQSLSVTRRFRSKIVPRNIQTAIVLAAGAGTRFWPYNVVRNKAAFPICNVPVVRRLVDDLVQLGVSRISVVVGPGEASVRAALRGAAGPLSFVRQPKPDGTAAAGCLLAGRI